MLVLDTTGRIQYANGAIHRILGREADEVHSEVLYRFLYSDEVDEFREQFAELVGGDVSRMDLTVRIHRNDEEERWCRISLSFVTPEESSPFIFALVEDVTEQKRGQDRLRREKESAERATKTKSAFLANMSHEIRTPIHTITGMAELLMETQIDPEQREYGQQIRFASEVLLGLVNDILDFSKIEAGKLTLELIDFDVARTVEEAVDMVSLEAHKKSLDVVLDIAPHIPRYIKGDPVRIRQIVVNLFNNAVKFTEEGSITIQVRNAPTAKSPALIISVNDTGVGVEESKLSRLFRPFSQVDPSTTRKYGGTGLGLSICRSLVELMDGRIGVQSSPGKGSSFWFTLPVSYADTYHGEPWIPQLDVDISTRVLLVDDNGNSRRTLAGYLSTWGFPVDTAATGEEALEKLISASEAGEPYGLALVDMLLPGIDGWQVASEVNADKRINDIRLLLMSPTGIMGGEAKMKLLNWFNAYVNKPVKWVELAGALKQALREAVDLESAEDLESIAEAEPVEELSSLSEPETPSGRSGPAEERAEDVTLGESARILVAEDHLVNQQLFRTILEKLGHDVEVADNGRIALEKVQEFDPHVVFLDVQMPEIGGYEAARTLRDRGFRRPIIAVTANAQSGEREKCIDYGMDDYMSKPFKPRDVRGMMARWLTDDLFERDDAQSRNSSAAGSSESPPVFDLAAALDSFMGKRDVVDRVMNGFLEKLESQLEELKRALAQDDLQTVYAVAHSVKGGALSLEAVRLGRCAERLELVAAGSEPGEVPSLFLELGREAEDLSRAWEELRGQSHAIASG